MQVVLEDAKEAYEEDDDDEDDTDGDNKNGQKGTVVELQSNGQEDLDENVQRIETWISHWLQQRDHPGEDQ